MKIIDKKCCFRSFFRFIHLQYMGESGIIIYDYNKGIFFIMKEEIIQSIKNAEAQAQEIKRNAESQAQTILAEAEENARRAKDSAREVCKAYTETQIKNAKAEAERRYDDAICAREKSAREYCAKVLENAENTVLEIVGRIIRGDS